MLQTRSVCIWSIANTYVEIKETIVLEAFEAMIFVIESYLLHTYVRTQNEKYIADELVSFVLFVAYVQKYLEPYPEDTAQKTYVRIILVRETKLRTFVRNYVRTKIL